MESTECNGGSQFSAIKDSKGRLIFTTIKGVSILDPAKLEKNPVPPLIEAEKIVADGMPLKISKTVDIEAGTRRIEILFTGLSFTAPHRNIFSYRLDGYEEDWSPHRPRQRRPTQISIPAATHSGSEQPTATGYGIWRDFPFR